MTTHKKIIQSMYVTSYGGAPKAAHPTFSGFHAAHLQNMYVTLYGGAPEVVRRRRRTLRSVDFTLHTFGRTLRSVDFTLHTFGRTLRSVDFTLHAFGRTLRSVDFMLCAFGRPHFFGHPVQMRDSVPPLLVCYTPCRIYREDTEVRWTLIRLIQPR